MPAAPRNLQALNMACNTLQGSNIGYQKDTGRESYCRRRHCTIVMHLTQADMLQMLF